MKITSLNVAGYKNWESRETRIVQYLDDENPDLVFLQEVKFDPKYSPLTQSVQLNSRLLHRFPYTTSAISRTYDTDGVHMREGLSVLSRHPITDTEVLVLKKQPDDKHTRIIQNVSVMMMNNTIRFTNVHLSNNEYAAEQLEETLAIAESRNEQRIILGDFNIQDLSTFSGDSLANYLVSSDFYDYVSFPSEEARFDYMLLPRHCSFRSFTSTPGLSDHNALAAEVVLADHAN